jgi:hypothetical protein
VGPAPLPPHERNWRHPSELAADERELVRLSEASPSTRAFAMVTGTVGLLAIAALMLTLTPRREPSPVALQSTTIPNPRVESLAVVPPAQPVTTRLALTVTVRLATPIGDGKRALMTLAGSRADEGTEFDVQLTSGPVVTAVVSSTTDEMMIVSIASAVEGHTVATAPPGPDEMVTILLDPPVMVPFSEVASVDADEGTPVLDDDGDLVGLCTRGQGDTSVVDVTAGSDTVDPDASEPSVADSSLPGSSITASSAPATSAAAATSAAP